jgi:tRNA(Ile)-lysidine synthase
MKSERGGKGIAALAAHPFLSKVRGTILRHRMLSGGETVVVAVSGGPDSMALLKVLEHLREELALRIVVAHFNHGLRGEESARDEEFVRRSAAQTNLVLECGRADIPRLLPSSKRSMEDLCRRKRYDFLCTVAGRCGAQRIALGHHLHDQAETVLMNLLRGSGPRGLKGMQPMRNALLIRPLLERGRDEILRFVEECGIEYVRDSSNVSERFLRNRLRKSLLPEMRHFNPRLDVALVKTAEILRNEDQYLQEIVEERLRGWGTPRKAEAFEVPVDALRLLHPALENRILKELLERMTPEGTGIGYEHILAVARMIARLDSCGEISLPNGIVARCDSGKKILILKKRDREDMGGEEKTGAACEFSVEPPAVVAMDDIGAALHFSWAEREGMDFSVAGRAYMDGGRIEYPLVVRNRRPGDRFQPLGMAEHKKLKDFFIDMKLPRERRDGVPLVADQKSILWVAPWRLSERVKITGATRKILMVEMKRRNDLKNERPYCIDFA